MTLKELLKLLREGILNDRTDRVEGSGDYLWTDETLVTYINEAQRRFAVKGLVLRDASTPEITTVTLVAGQSEYDLHESVISVISARGGMQQADLTRVGHALLAAYRSPASSWVDPAAYTHMPAGPSLAYATDEGLTADELGSLSRVSLRVYPTPSAAQAGQTIRLRVLRKPIKLTPADMEVTPEIPEDHHIEMLDWAAYLALRIVDDDAGAPRRAEEFRVMFEEHVKAARTMVMRKLFAPTPWGFGRGGFSWDQ